MGRLRCTGFLEAFRGQSLLYNFEGVWLYPQTWHGYCYAQRARILQSQPRKADCAGPRGAGKMRCAAIWAIWAIWAIRAIIFPKSAIQPYTYIIIILSLISNIYTHITHLAGTNGAFPRLSIWAIRPSIIAHTNCPYHPCFVNKCQRHKPAQARMGNYGQFAWVNMGNSQTLKLPICLTLKLALN